MGDGLTSSFNTAMSFLYGFIDYERSSGWKYSDASFNLDRMRGLLDSLGNPHRNRRFVHVAGTNGKGSVSAIIAKALTLAGMRTGLYTSPHLIDFRERIRVDGRAISREDVIEGVVRLTHAAVSTPGLTFFEVWTALAFDYFRHAKTDAAVLETGMGGRLDATNVVVPDISVITSISMDHQGILGDTPTAIAREKAGIIKPGVAVVTAPQTDDVTHVLDHAASDNGSAIVYVGTNVTFRVAGDRLFYSGTDWNIDDVNVPIGGAVSRFTNTAVALAALEQLSRTYTELTADSAREAVETVRWPGRFETVAHHPEVIVDGACNTDAIRDVIESIGKRFDRENTVALVAMCRDKNAAETLPMLARKASRFVVTAVDNPRMFTPESLSRFVPSDVGTIVESNVERALAQAVECAGENGLVIVTGSLYLVAEVMKAYGIDSIETI